MDIAKLGIEIDPRRAVRGADRVEKELKEVGRAADKNLGKVDKGVKKVGVTVDRTGKKVQTMGRKSKRSFGQMTSGAIGLLDGVGLMNNGIGSMVRRFEGAGRGIKMLTNAQKSLGKRSAESGASLRAMGSGAKAGRAGALGMVAGLAPLIAAIAAVATAAIAAVVAFKAMKLALGFLMDGLKTAGQMQKLTISLMSLTGSAEKTNMVLDSLRESAEKTGISIADQAGSIRKFIALGFDPADAVKLQRNILDVAGAVGLTTTEANLLGSALAQVQSKGVVSMEELRQQIAEKGIPVMDELQRKTGKFGQAFFKAVADGQIAASELIDIFLNMEGGFARFSGGALKMAQSYDGALQRISIGLELLKADVAGPIAVALTPALTKLADFIQSAAPAAKAFGEQIANGVKVVMQTIQDGSITKALGLALSAGIEWGIGFLIRAASLAFIKMSELLLNAFVWSIDAFFSLMTGAITMIGGSTKEEVGGSLTDTAKGFQKVMIAIAAILGLAFKNALGEAMDSVATGFKNVMVGIINLIVKGLNKAVDTAISLAPGAGTVLDAFGMNKRVPEVPIGPDANFFTPTPIDYAGLNRVLLDILPSQNQEEFGDFVGNQLDRFDKANPTAPIEPFEPPKPILPEEEIPDAIAVKAEKVKTAAEGALTPIQALISAWGDFDANMQDFTVGTLQTFSSSMTDGVMAIIDGTKSAGEAFGDMAASILQQVMQMIVQLTIQAALVQAIGGSPFAGLLTSAPGVIPNALPVAHGGASGGVDSVGSRMNGSTSSSERRAIVDKNESVLTRSDSQNLEMDLARARGDNAGDSKSGSQGVTIVNALDPQTVQDAIAANPSVVFNAISRNRKQFKAMMK
tara:strand:- start:13268 stop:15847 length:2580 start_codon:yes stop_codon:yes gene_type:complete